MTDLASSTLVLATHNAGKVKEIKARLVHLPYEIVPIHHYSTHAPEETGKTFIENAIIKARFACQKSGLPALADDSGLIVDALAGAPGVNSARFAGDHVSGDMHNTKLLSLMTDVPSQQRTARFVCVLVLLESVDDPMPVIFQGCLEGSILSEPQGEGGFGYDPVFYIPRMKCTAAQLTDQQKANCSHRGQALDQFLKWIDKKG